MSIPSERAASEHIVENPVPTRGFFITLEGGEGTGKSTQARKLVARFEAQGLRAIATREPGGSPNAEILRDILLSGVIKPLGPLAEALMFSAARIDHLDQVIKPALAAGTTVVSDRFADSTRVYQGVAGNLDPHRLTLLEQAVLNGTVPDLTLVLDLAPETGLARAAARRANIDSGDGPDRFESEDLTYHRRLREAFRALPKREPGRCLLIDADASADIVTERLWTAIQQRLLHPNAR
ncbi:dTMP kinase [Beijerinckia indica]|uniref:Thymidylate kinase n=1 Tax=Beijerinckia indica subsp. indica (strain ATCC 9039 / DSM 1715 / NCIMB 8712) TaxID=395963 RepID=B2IB85_BEII9|nr:dTMP kinase [Beijerinckia indica]ACB95169.1 dTMP kinase [Beijerinckia indica subsp. indica ATCC 9039]